MFLKVDVEGHELDVFSGAKDALRKGSIKNIQFEFGGCNIDTRTFFQDFWYLLTGYGYTLYRIMPDGSLYRINNYAEKLEAFICTNYFAEIK